MFGCGSLYLFLLVTGWSLSDDDYARLRSTRIIRIHCIDFFLFYKLCLVLSYVSGLSSLWFLAREAVSGVGSPFSMGLKLDQLLLGHSHKLRITFTPAQIAQWLIVLAYTLVDVHVCVPIY